MFDASWVDDSQRRAVHANSAGVVERLAGRRRGRRRRRRRRHRSRAVHRRRGRGRRRALDHRTAVDRRGCRPHDHAPGTRAARAGLCPGGIRPLPRLSCAGSLRSLRTGSPTGAGLSAGARTRLAGLGRLGRDRRLRRRRDDFDGRRDRDGRLRRTRLRRGLLCHERDGHRQRGNGHHDSDTCAILACHIVPATCRSGDPTATVPGNEKLALRMTRRGRR
ncbi:MAG: hypothetical protein QOI48_1106 [Solirubrobacteraceae bacterium]|jgi:hypothetical protein|nr:hypothetical protein [Solirubrobacteraceae bacterium]